MSSLAILPAAALGCGDDDGTGGGGGGTGGGVGGGTGGGTGGGAGDAGACEQQVQSNNPGASFACASCLCTNCGPQLDACNADPNCNSEVTCAQTAVGNGTCPGDATGLPCLQSTCGFTLADPSGLLLVCIAGSCTAECAPGDGGA